MENTVKIGSLLKAAREKKKISLEDVANKTKININTLKALESDDISSLPNKTYVKGFVKNYAKTISLDTNEALEALENTYGTKEPETISEQVENLETYEEKEAKVELEEIQESVRSIITSFFNKKIFISIAALVVIYIIGKGVTSFFMTLSQEQKSITKSDAEIKEIKQDDGTIKSIDKSLFDLESSKKLAEEQSSEENTELTEKDIVEEKVEENKDEIQPIAPEKLAKAAVVKESEKREAKIEEEKEIVEEKKEEVAEKEEKKVNIPRGKLPFVNFYPAPRELYSIVEDAPENTDDEIFPKPFRNAMEEGKQNIFIHATKGDTWLSYRVDSEEIKRFVLKKGRSVFIKGDVILLFMGNLNVTHIFYNNKLIDAPTRTGVKSIIFPEEAAKNFQLPLFPSYKGVPYVQEDYKERMMDEPSA